MKTAKTLLDIFLCINEKQPCTEKDVYNYLFGEKDKKITFRNFQRYIEALAKSDFVRKIEGGPVRNEKGQFNTNKQLIVSENLIKKLNK